MGILSRLGSMASKARQNADWYGSGSNAVLGALTGGFAAGVGGGDMADIGRGALLGGAGGAMGAAAGIPGLSHFAGPIAGTVAGISEIANDPQARLRRALREAQMILDEASLIDPAMSPKAIRIAFENHATVESPEMVSAAIARELERR